MSDPRKRQKSLPVRSWKKVHPLATSCLDCGWLLAGEANRVEARNHAAANPGHHVVIDVEQTTSYKTTEASDEIDPPTRSAASSQAIPSATQPRDLAKELRASLNRARIEREAGRR